MRNETKQQNKLSAWRTLILLSVLGISCSTLGTKSSHATPEVGARQDRNILTISKTPDNPIRISDASIRFWWWEEADVAGMDGDRPPPKKRYIDLTRWEYDGEGIKTYPQEVDFVSQVANDATSDFQGLVRFRLSARFTDYETRVYEGPGLACEGLPWLNDRNVFEQKISISPKREKKVEKGNYDLSKLMNEKVGKNNICSFRFTVEVFDLLGNSLMSKEKVIPVLLGD